MQSSFEVLEWESISKEQDSLVHKLFGEISESTASKTSLVTSSRDCNVNVYKGSKPTSKGEKRKALLDEESTRKPKKKRKDKRDKNKFKKDQKLNSQLTELSRDNQSETRTGTGCDEWASSVREAIGDDNVDNDNQIDHLKKEKRESLHNNETSAKQGDKPKKKRQRNKFKTDEKLNPELIETNEGACVDSVNQAKQAENVASVTMLNAEYFDKNKLSEEHIDSKMKKSKRKKAKEGSKEVKLESDFDLETNVKQKRKKSRNEAELDSSEQTTNDSTKLNDSPPASQNKMSLHDKMTKQLESSRFRWINEQLYTTTGDEAFALFSEDPSLFNVYHRGFTNQVKLWPVNPVDKIIEWLKKRPTSDVVADFGCGEAVIAQRVTNEVHSFDLVAKNKFVTACNMAKVPLNSESIDVAVFCLSLMGTNLLDFLREAHRVLKLGGILKVAEVTSRVSDTTEFAKSFSRLGFKLQKEDSSNKMFVLFDFIKDKESVKTVPSHKLDGLKLKPCIYKKR